MTQTKSTNWIKPVMAFIGYLLNVLGVFIKTLTLQAGTVGLFYLVVLDESTLTQLANMPMNELILLKNNGLTFLFNLSAITTALWVGWRDAYRFTSFADQVKKFCRKAS